ncbi:variable lymphocyte receptor A [Salpingoeca rosetta]|uniref:Variable lymphocyte receptor A n=1 Tax=Salpingoeca rosetta (strain ATCC 50818 / BSB-021) TaxID=946362 RepID=F2UBK4_SALR5|nr:variable lymphocyte receptor A [Salpingoeca rosetta]EGD73870.1 variable lymphocyte receptor A [Salpingoeca rosetta]|eukprot:XP_004993433.1 variable lymphocyte receptor A [Salpingoeca rosetta]
MAQCWMLIAVVCAAALVLQPLVKTASALPITQERQDFEARKEHLCRDAAKGLETIPTLLNSYSEDFALKEGETGATSASSTDLKRVWQLVNKMCIDTRAINAPREGVLKASGSERQDESDSARASQAQHHMANALLPQTYPRQERGDVDSTKLQPFLAATNWTSVKSLTLRGLRSPTFALHWLHTTPSVVELDISHNSVQTVDVCFYDGCLSQLISLDLSHNLLTEVPSPLFEVGKTITSLDLSHNFITVFEARTLLGLPITELDLSDNKISVIANYSFVYPAKVQVLDLRSNNLKHLALEVFYNCTSLTHIYLADNLLDEIEGVEFQPLQHLEVLDVSSNYLTVVKEGLATASLQSLYLHDNIITQVDRAAFSLGTHLKNLTLDGNQLQHLPEGVFAACRNLQALYLQHNQLKSVTQNTLQGGDSLTALYLSHNHLTEIKDLGLRKLATLDASFNQLDYFYLHSSALLTSLDLSDNPLSAVPDLTPLTQLQLYGQRDHFMAIIDLSVFANMTGLRVLDMDAAIGSTSAVVFSRHQAPAWSLSDLVFFHMANVIFPHEWLHGSNATANLISLHIGWPGLNETLLPNRQLCSLLGPEATELALESTSYTTLELCEGVSLKTVFLMNNSAIEHVFVHGSPNLVNVSGCSSLAEMSVPEVPVLDISDTKIPPHEALCDTQGSTILIARNWSHPRLGQNSDTKALITRCLEAVNVFDLSDNQWLASLDLVEAAARTVIFSTDPTLSPDGRYQPSRIAPQVFLTQHTLVECELNFDDPYIATDESVISRRLGYNFQCDCVFGSVQGGQCLQSAHSSSHARKVQAKLLAAVFFGGVATTIVCFFVGFRYLGRRTAFPFTRQQNNYTTV